MIKEELLKLVEKLPDDIEDEEIEEIDELIDRAIDMQFLLLMRACFRLRDTRVNTWNPNGIQVEPEDDEEELT